MNTGQLIEIKEARSKRRKLFDTPRPESQVNNPESFLDINGLSVLEIKQKLKELGRGGKSIDPWDHWSQKMF